MDSAVAAAQQPPPPVQGQQRARRVCFCSCVLNLVLFLAVTASFAGAAYRARRRPRDLAFVAAAYYLLALLLCCVAKLEQLRVRADPAAAQQRPRAMLAAWAVSAALSVMFASRVAGAMPLLPLKLAVWAVTAAFLALGLCLLLRCREDSGSRPATPKASRQLSPEEMA